MHLKYQCLTDSPPKVFHSRSSEPDRGDPERRRGQAAGGRGVSSPWALLETGPDCHLSRALGQDAAP